MIDLHTHSTVSDGSDAPERIPMLAVEAGCTAVALTDHDRLDGIPAARAAAEEVGVELVPGCELSCEVPFGTMHLLVYFLEPGDGPLQDELGRLQDVRDQRNRVMCDRLGLSYDDLQAEAGGMGAGRPHAAAMLVREGRASSIQDAFDRFLGKNRPGYVEKARLAPGEAMSLAVASGGVPVLAHPTSLDLKAPALRSRLEELRALGLVGVESYYGRYSKNDRTAMASLAASLGLVATGGSDHHGTYKPDLSVGTGTGDLDVPDAALEALKERRPT